MHLESDGTLIPANSFSRHSYISTNDLPPLTHAPSMITKPYDRAFELPLSAEQFASIRNRYEWLRKTELYRNGRMKKTFETKQCLARLETEMSSMTDTVHTMKVNLGFSKDPETQGETRWKEYGATVLRLYQAYAKRNISLGLSIGPQIGRAHV